MLKTEDSKKIVIQETVSRLYVAALFEDNDERLRFLNRITSKALYLSKQAFGDDNVLSVEIARMSCYGHGDVAVLLERDFIAVDGTPEWVEDLPDTTKIAAFFNSVFSHAATE